MAIVDDVFVKVLVVLGSGVILMITLAWYMSEPDDD